MAHTFFMQQMGKQTVQNRRGFTLIEIMVVVIVIGILAATIIPQFVGTTHDAKVGSAKAQVAQLESALERFNVHMDRYPTTEEGLKALVAAVAGEETKWRGPYIKLLRPDPWGNPYQYRPGSVTRTASTFGPEAPMAPMVVRPTVPILETGRIWRRASAGIAADSVLL